jgi:hypothetical protein
MVVATRAPGSNASPLTADNARKAVRLFLRLHPAAKPAFKRICHANDPYNVSFARIKAFFRSLSHPSGANTPTPLGRLGGCAFSFLAGEFAPCPELWVRTRVALALRSLSGPRPPHPVSLSQTCSPGPRRAR